MSDSLVRRSRRNPTWAREELILALDLYLREGLLDDKDSRVVALSETLNRLPIHGDRPDAARFRNPNGVALKLANFAALDPTHEGKGMSRGGSRDREIWEEYGQDEDALREAASRIREGFIRSDAPASAGVRVSSVAVEALNRESFAVDRAAASVEAVRREQRLVLAYKDHLEKSGRLVSRHKYEIDGHVLYCDLCDESERVLYEAKGDTRRESVRMAVGQLFDYRRFEAEAVAMRVLLPRKPAPDMVSYLHSIAIGLTFPAEGGRWEVSDAR